MTNGKRMYGEIERTHSQESAWRRYAAKYLLNRSIPVELIFVSALIPDDTIGILDL